MHADSLLERELIERSRIVQKEVLVSGWYKGSVLSTQRVDLIVDNNVLVEIKSTGTLPPTAKRQLLNYLRATSFQVGLLLHFGPTPRFARLVHSEKAHSALIR